MLLVFIYWENQIHLDYVGGEEEGEEWDKGWEEDQDREWDPCGCKGEKGRSRKASGWEENPSRKKQRCFFFFLEGGNPKPRFRVVREMKSRGRFAEQELAMISCSGTHWGVIYCGPHRETEKVNEELSSSALGGATELQTSSGNQVLLCKRSQTPSAALLLPLALPLFWFPIFSVFSGCSFILSYL